MRIHPVARACFIVWVSLSAAACASSLASRYYTLDSTASPQGGAAADYSVSVGAVTIPATVDRPQFVVQAGTNRVAVDEINRWASPLDDAIARAVAGNLAALLGTPRVARGPLANFEPDYLVTIDVQRFESVPDESALLEAVWTVSAVAGGQKRSGRTVAREETEGKGFEALAAAHSRALAKLSADIAEGIRAEASSGEMKSD